jgi:Rrf2 family nitric oxide-sensitive transcriptional repressor
VRLTRFTDYALRTLIYLGAHDERAVPLGEIAAAYGISHNHLVKVAVLLGDLGVVQAARGRRGGLRLAKRPEEINIGWLVRRTEPDLHLVECFDVRGSCPITGACVLREALYEARGNFLSTLDRYTLASFVSERRNQLIQLWGTGGDSGGSRPVPAVRESTSWG